MTLSSDELTSMRSAAQAVFPDVVTIKRKTRTSDSAGGFTIATATVETSICRISPANQAAIRLFESRIGERQAFTIDFPHDTDVVEDDQVIISTVTYEVLGILSGSWEITRQTVCVRLE